MIVFFLGGMAVGLALYHAYAGARIMTIQAEAERQSEWLLVEMKRLRAQVAMHIGKDSYGGTASE